MKKNQEYFSQLYQKYADILYRFGMGMGIHHDMCLDVIHDVFCKLLQIKKDFDPDIKNYLIRSFINRHTDILRSRKKITTSDANNLPDEEKNSIENLNAEDEIIEAEERENLKRKVEYFLSLLTDRQRMGVYLRFMEEMEYDEIGKILNMSNESVRKLVYRGLEKIRAQVKKNEKV